MLEALRSNYDMKAHTRGDSRQAGTLTDDFVDRFAIVGPPERCIERLQALQALGLDKVAISGATRGAAEDGCGRRTKARCRTGAARHARVDQRQIFLPLPGRPSSLHIASTLSMTA